MQEPSAFGWDEEQPCLCGSSPECHPPHATLACFSLSVIWVLSVDADSSGCRLLSYGMVRSWAEEAMFYAIVLPPQDGDAILEQQIWDVDFGVRDPVHKSIFVMEGSWL